MVGKRKVLIRTNNALILQPRDITILKEVYRYGFLNSCQIKALCGFSLLKRTNDRLRKLYDNGYLSRKLWVNEIKKELLYFLGPKGVELVVLETKADSLKVKRKRGKCFRIKDSHLTRLLLINQFKFALEMAIKNHAQIELSVWNYKKVMFLDEDQKIFSDAYFQLKREGKISNFFLVIDWLESGKAIKKRIQSYLDYGIEGAFERQFGLKYYKALIVCQTENRLRSVLGIIARMTDKMFLVSSLKDITPESIFADIWQKPLNERKVLML